MIATLFGAGPVVVIVVIILLLLLSSIVKLSIMSIRKLLLDDERPSKLFLIGKLRLPFDFLLSSIVSTIVILVVDWFKLLFLSLLMVSMFILVLFVFESARVDDDGRLNERNDGG